MRHEAGGGQAAAASKRAARDRCRMRRPLQAQMVASAVRRRIRCGTGRDGAVPAIPDE
jgi:hypothetical protein